MTINEMRRKILMWVDFYGQDIANTEAIKKAKTKEQLKQIVEDHKRWLQDQNEDAIRHINNFMRNLK